MINKLLELKPIWRKYIVVFHDILMSIFAVLASFWLRFGSIPSGQHEFADDLIVTLAITVPIAGSVYWLCGLYRGMWQFASTHDLANILRAASVVAVSLMVIDFVARGQVVVPRTVVFAYWILQIVLLSVPRLLYRTLADRLRKESHAADATSALIVGTGAEAAALIRFLQLVPHPRMRVEGLLAQNRADLKRTIRGIPVLGLTDDLEKVVSKLARRGVSVRRLLFTRESLERQKNPVALIEEARRLDLVVGRQAGSELGSHMELAPKFAPVRMEDLLERPTLQLNEAELRSLVSGRGLLVTGGGGSIGSEICRQAAGLGARLLVIAENSEFALYQVLRAVEKVRPNLTVIGRICDVRERGSVDALFAEFHPDLVFHAAALKHLPIVEDNRVAGALTNVIGTRNVADAAKAHGALAMVLISTDKAIRPTSFLGATKRVAELYCQALDAHARAVVTAGKKRQTRQTPTTRFLSVRFGNVLASTGSVLTVFREQIEHGGPVTVTHPDMERYFMTESEATSLVLLATAHGLATPEHDLSVFMLDMGKPIRIMDLAHRMIRLAGFEPDKDIPIEITGMRPGERLQEELFRNEEQITRIDVEGIFAAKPRLVPLSALTSALRSIEVAAKKRNEPELMALIGALVPDYSAGRQPEEGTDADGLTEVGGEEPEKAKAGINKLARQTQSGAG